jgi:hypothetical protein
VTTAIRPPRRPALLLTLISVAILMAACGGTVTPAVDATLPVGGVPTVPGGGGGGGAANAGLPTIADGAYKSGTTHIELSGGRNETFDVGVGSGITSAGNTILGFTSADNTKVVQMSFLAPGQGAGALSVSTNVASTVFSTAGAWGQECQVKITRNNASGLSGEFSCKDAPGVSGLTALKINVKGTFSVER